ncbi:MAG: hypothetical protein HYY32_01420 [Chloroflexi bacterium]|nr:hypothetical protein [Chloroflexota bacterium]
MPSSSVVCDGFARMGSMTAAGQGMPNLPMAEYPGNVAFASVEQLQTNVSSITVDQIIRGLTVQPEEAGVAAEPQPRDIVFKGTFEEVNRHFYDKEWSDGLPIVPPSIEKTEQFLRFTGRPAGEVVGVLLPDRREATVWSIAVNGVMAGCRPEYMPVLVAMVEAMADPKFGQEHLGHTPGGEVLITVNGPIIKDLGFNCEQGALRIGFEANTTIGRFWRLYLRNVAGFLPHKTDKGTFGGNFRVVLAENEDAVAKIGWQPMSVDQGFQAGDNLVTVAMCVETNQALQCGAPTAEGILKAISARMADNQLFVGMMLAGQRTRPQIIMTPCLAEVVARAGYSKQRVRQYFYDQARVPVSRLRPIDRERLESGIRTGMLPKQFSESNDLEREIPLVLSPDDFMITVSGDPARDHCCICMPNGMIGYPVSKKIELVANWRELSKER